MSEYLGFFQVDERNTKKWSNLQQLKDYMSKLQAGKYIIKISEFKPERTIHQNKFYWKLIEIIAREIGYETEEMHELYKYKYLKKTVEDKNGNLVKGVGSTAVLNVQEFTEYIEKIKRHATELKITLPDSLN